MHGYREAGYDKGHRFGVGVVQAPVVVAILARTTLGRRLGGKGMVFGSLQPPNPDPNPNPNHNPNPNPNRNGIREPLGYEVA